MEQTVSTQDYSTIEAWIDSLSFGEVALVALAISTMIVSILAWLFRKKHKQHPTISKKD
ncbi:MAG: hypothetical protein IPI97_03525 [Nitrosomonas sp.]|nr:hypothetical protein [Nitrosomonas sp.]MBK7364108.1 hypothetical protein [Nitrosomonas sp.]